MAWGNLAGRGLEIGEDTNTYFREFTQEEREKWSGARDDAGVQKSVVNMVEIRDVYTLVGMTQ